MTEHSAVLTIAGSDSGGGAGIQADLKAFSAMGVFGTSVITAVTAQNLQGVTGIHAIPVDIIQKQLLAVLEGFPVKAIKTGMLFSAAIIDRLAEILSQNSYRYIPLVIDPVFVATSGSLLIKENAIRHLKAKLFPLATLLTPNIPEAEKLTGLSIQSLQELKNAARKLYELYGAAILVKGGHLHDRFVSGMVDIMCDFTGIHIYKGESFSGVNTHGSGCTLSSAIAAAMARGESLRQAIQSAKNYIQQTMASALPLSPTLKVMNHFPPSINR